MAFFQGQGHPKLNAYFFSSISSSSGGGAGAHSQPEKVPALPPHTVGTTDEVDVGVGELAVN